MRFLKATTARQADFNCSEWSEVQANATRDQVAGGRFVHDEYSADFVGDFERAVEALLAYEIFAPHRMIARVCTPAGRVAVGATIIQRLFLGPVSIESAVRVIEVDRTLDAASFAYATLKGHPELGVASFAVRRAGTAVRFEAQAWSRAGHWLAALGRPIARAIQRSITREAVASFCKLASK